MYPPGSVTSLSAPADLSAKVEKKLGLLEARYVQKDLTFDRELMTTLCTQALQLTSEQLSKGYIETVDGDRYLLVKEKNTASN